MKKNAFAIVHFGSKPKYLELEIYLAIMLRKNSKADIVYLYSVNDTPNEFVKTIGKFVTKTVPYDDDGITYNIKNFKSYYTHFNTLRTCNFIFAYNLTEYKKICLIESDMIILRNIDDIFDLNTPSVLTYYYPRKILENFKIKLNTNKNFEECSKKSYVNGGIMLLNPSKEKFKESVKNIKKIISYNCLYPNEMLFLMGYKEIYNLPFKYNGVQYNLETYKKNFNLDMEKYMSIIHINSNEYKHVDVIRDKWLNKIKENKRLLYIFICSFKKIYYEKYQDKIEKLLKPLDKFK